MEEFQIGLHASGTYEIHEYVAVGLFARLDRGQRSAARFAGFDAAGRTVVQDDLGGPYLEFWFGPVARFSWRMLSVDVGYAVIGVRDDNGRSDLASSSGDTAGAFSVNPAIAWMFAFSGGIPLNAELELVLKVEYRIRYYNKRAGEVLSGNIQHGTQSIAPLIGISWRF